MKRIVLTISIVFYSAGLVYSQGALQSFIFDHHQEKFREAKPEVVYRSIQGNPYYTKDFTSSTIYFADRDSIVVPLRYDVYQDEIEFRQNEKVIWLIKKDVKAIAHGNERIVNRTLKDGKTNDYLFVVVEGKYSLLRKERVNLLPAEPPKGFAESKPARFESAEDEYYIEADDLQPVPIFAKRDLEKLFHENVSALAFMKDEKIKAGKEADLVKLVEFLNKNL